MMAANGWRVSEVPFKGILASAVHSPVGRSDTSLSILWLLEIPSFDFRLKPFARPPAVDQNASRFIGTSEESFWSTFPLQKKPEGLECKSFATC